MSQPLQGVMNRYRSSAFYQNITSKMRELEEGYQQLPPRDQLALTILGVFLGLLIVVGGGYWLHHHALLAQERADEERQTLLWMRGQAPMLHASSDQSQPLSAIVQSSAAQQGLMVTTTDAAGRLSVTTSHQSFAVLGNWLTRLAQQGVQIDQLDVEQQPGGILQLQALLSKP